VRASLRPPHPVVRARDSATIPDRHRLTPLEIASGWVLGTDVDAPAGTEAEPDETPLAALERVILPALLRPPCLVSFSGGRDSSAVLAVASHLARREGLPLPVPATHRFPNAPDTQETEWQERVVVHLGLQEWVRLEWEDELDLVGPIAIEMLRRHGVLWPYNLHFHIPLLEAARHGSLLTGVGGDEVFRPTRFAHAAAVLAGEMRPRARDVLRVGLALAPRPVRRAVMRRRDPGPGPASWLRYHARETVAAAFADHMASEPMRWGDKLRWWWRLRFLQMFFSHARLLAADVDVRIEQPLADPAFLAALGRQARLLRFADRTTAMRLLFADRLPDELCARPTKAMFGQPFWNRHSREFAARAADEGLDAELVDGEGLRALWSSGEVNVRTFLLLQAAWLAEDRAVGGKLAPDGLEQASRDLREGIPPAGPAELPAR
jgi:asparagine synthetase B (glutamine-hydrolysing)